MEDLSKKQSGVFQWLRLPLFVILGICMGIIAKSLDASRGYIQYSLGCALSGTLFWALTCTLLAVPSKNRAFAFASVFCFLFPMLISYYYYSKNVVGYFNMPVMKFWCFMLLPASFLGAVIWKCRKSRRMCILLGTGSVILFIADLWIVGFGGLFAEIIVFVLMMITVAKLYRRARKHNAG